MGASSLLALSTLFLTGCTVYEHDHRDHDRVVVEEHREVRPVEIRERPVEVRRPGRVLIIEGRHLIEFRAPRNGIATVIDIDNSREILSTPLGRGDHLTFDPDKNKAYVNDHKVYDRDINSKHTYRIYFEEGR